MTGYSARVGYSSKELTTREKIKVKDLTQAIPLAEVTKTSPVVFDVDYYARIDINNPLSPDAKEYSKYVIVTKQGDHYTTGSESFISSLEDILEEFSGTEEDFEVQAYRMPSKNRQGAEFITCSLV